MPDASGAVQSALESVLTEDTETNVDSQSTESNPEVAAALKETLKNQVGASDEKTVEDKSTKDTDKETKTVPYERLSQVVKQKNELSERSKNLEEQLKAAVERENELRGRVGTLEQDKQILDAVKNLAHDDRYRPHVEALDRALQGLDEEIEKAEEGGDKKAESEALKKFEEKTEQLEDLFADQRAEQLWSETYDRAKQMLAALPEDYTDEDRAIIGELWTPRVDWDTIEAEGSNAIPEALNSSLANVIRDYGIPRGALVNKAVEETKSKIPNASILSDEETVKGILEKKWSETDDKGQPVLSEEEFKKGMAEVIRRTRGGA